VVAITFYGMSTFEGPLLSVKSVNALSHYTDWTIAHVHAGALGWVGFMTFGMLYWLIPRMFQAPLHSKRWANLHFWIATIGILLYIVPIYVAGLTQGLMWRAIDSSGAIWLSGFHRDGAGADPDVLVAHRRRLVVSGGRFALCRQLLADHGRPARSVRRTGAPGGAAGARLGRAAEARVAAEGSGRAGRGALAGSSGRNCGGINAGSGCRCGSRCG
jgi:hypothetical protein